MKILKLLAIMMVCLLVANIILYTIGRLSTLLFWIIIITLWVITYVIKEVKYDGCKEESYKEESYKEKEIKLFPLLPH